LQTTVNQQIEQLESEWLSVTEQLEELTSGG